MKSISPLIVAALASCAIAFGDQPKLVPAEDFVVPDGMEVTVWATTPLLHNPTNMDIDHLGRIGVAQGKNYRMFRNASLFGKDQQGDAFADADCFD